MMKWSLFLSLCLLAGVQTTTGSSVLVADVRSPAENPIRQFTGENMPNGQGMIRIGYFENLGITYTEAEMRGQMSYATLNDFVEDHFVAVGEGGPGLGDVTETTSPRFITRMVNGVSASGRLVGTIQNVSPVTPLVPNFPYDGRGVPAGSRMFLLIYDGSSPTTSLGIGLYSATNWLMPADPFLNVVMNTVDVDDSREVFFGSLVGGGGFGGGLWLGVPPIPEPSTGGVLVLSLRILWLRRRR